MNTNAMVMAEHDLFCKVCEGKILFRDEIESEIRKIIDAYVLDSEVKSFMRTYDITQRDFEYMFYELFSVIDFFEYIYIGKIKCLFPTAVLLDDECIHFMGIYLGNRNKFTDKTWHEILLLTAMECGKLFFNREAVKQNIVDKNYYLTMN